MGKSDVREVFRSLQLSWSMARLDAGHADLQSSPNERTIQLGCGKVEILGSQAFGLSKEKPKPNPAHLEDLFGAIGILFLTKGIRNSPFLLHQLIRLVRCLYYVHILLIFAIHGHMLAVSRWGALSLTAQ